MKKYSLFTAQLKEQLATTNHSMESLSKSTKIPLLRIKEIFAGKEPTINELYLLSINLQISTGTLLHLFVNNKYDVISSFELEQLIENQDVLGIVNLLVNNRLIRTNQRIHYTNQDCAVDQMVPIELLNKMFDLLLKHNYVTLVRKHLRYIDELNIKSIYDLDKYGLHIKEELLFGSKSNKLYLFNLTDYLVSLINNVKTNEKIILLKEIEIRYSRYKKELNLLASKGETITNLSECKLISKQDKSISIIDNNDFTKINMFEEGKELINKILVLQHECILITNKI